jgi:hypothetical protein
MGHQASHTHDSDDERIGKHIDVYHTNSAGQRDQSHRTDLKISYDPNKPFVRDIEPPKK